MTKPESMVITRTVSPLKRIFDSDMPKENFSQLCGLKNEPLHFSVAYRSKMPKRENKLGTDTPIAIRVTSTLPVSVYKVCKVPFAASECEDAEKGAVGPCPDMLLPRIAAPEIKAWPQDTKLPFYEDGQRNTLNASCFATQSVFICINENGEQTAAGEHEVLVEVIGLMSGEVIAAHTVTVQILNASLPENDLIYTNWFHYDCLADITHTPLYSNAYFELLGKYLKNSAQNGMNTLLFPAFTPPLDTPIGGERMNTQLVKVTKNNGKYTFDFTLAERFAAVAKAAGIRTLEHTHLFSQWGAENAITVYATVDGEEGLLFDYRTSATDKEYERFLSEYLTAFKEYEKRIGMDVLYHISDEPVLKNLEGYRRAKTMMREIFPDGKFADALDAYEFYKEGLVEMPIVDIESIENYDVRCDSLMLYYTGGESRPGLTNRLLTSAPRRTRALGYILYRYDAKGFLHWGYNFYYGRLSNGCFHPAQDPCFYKNYPGVTYLVYPDTDGAPLPSLREKQMLAAMNDYRALRLLESLIGREKTLALCEKMLGEEITVTAIAKSDEIHLALRDAINGEIAKHLK